MPATTGLNLENAVRNHQRRSDQSSGVSTTTSYQAAIGYATNKGTKNGIVAVIKRDILAAFQIKEEDCAASGRRPLKLDDKEIILSDNTGNPMPRDIIEKLINIKSSLWKKLED